MWPKIKITPVEGVPEGVMFFMNPRHVNLQPIAQDDSIIRTKYSGEVEYWDGAMWVAFHQPIDSIIIDITEPEPDEPDTVMEFSFGEEF